MKNRLFSSLVGAAFFLALTGVAVAAVNKDYKPGMDKTTQRHVYTETSSANGSRTSEQGCGEEQKLVVVVPKGYFKPGDRPLFVVSNPSEEVFSP
jgi:hypothetical protein